MPRPTARRGGLTHRRMGCQPASVELRSREVGVGCFANLPGGASIEEFASALPPARDELAAKRDSRARHTAFRRYSSGTQYGCSWCKRLRRLTAGTAAPLAQTARIAERDGVLAPWSFRWCSSCSGSPFGINSTTMGYGSEQSSLYQPGIPMRGRARGPAVRVSVRGQLDAGKGGLPRAKQALRINVDGL